jgi:hypothetical protein
VHIYRYVLVASNNNDKKANRTSVIIYDLRNKHICLSTILPIGEDVVRVLRDGAIAYVFTSAGTLIRFVEKSTASKIDILLTNKKGPLYPTAIILAAEVKIYMCLFI